MVIARFCAAELPTFTLPNASEPGTVNCVETPVPLTGTVAGEVAPSLRIPMFALKLPVAVGAKAKLSVAVEPGLMIEPVARPLTVNGLVAPEMPVKVTAVPPVFVMMTFC